MHLLPEVRELASKEGRQHHPQIKLQSSSLDGHRISYSNYLDADLSS